MEKKTKQEAASKTAGKMLKGMILAMPVMWVTGVPALTAATVATVASAAYLRKES